MRVGLFPGQGLDARAIGDRLPNNDPRLQRANEILGLDLTRALSRSRSSTVPTRIAQPAIFVAGIISFENALRRGDRFQALVGHSLGEYTALAVAGGFSFSDGVTLVAARGEAMSRAARASSGGMAAVLGLETNKAEELALGAGASVANDNSPTQLVIAGDGATLRKAAGMVSALGGRCVLLSVEGAFHSSAMDPAVAALADALDHAEMHTPRIPVVANVSARPYRAPGEIRKLLLRQLTGRVRFRESIEWCIERGANEFVDLGPGRVVEKIAKATYAPRRVVTADA
jgi:malonyl CoA-acyl carrier protein transacylase